MGFLKKFISNFKEDLHTTFHHTKFTIRRVEYDFVTDKEFSEINEIVGREAGIIRNIRRYNVLMGYCKGNKLTFFKLSFSAKFLVMMRPFHGYMHKRDGKTHITGVFRFSPSTTTMMLVWIFNDILRLIGKLQQPIPTNFVGHIISILILPTFLIRMVWQDKKSQNYVIDFMEEHLGAKMLNKPNAHEQEITDGN